MKFEAASYPMTWYLWDGWLHSADAEGSHNGMLLSIFDVFNAMRRQAKCSELRRLALTPKRHAAYYAHHRAYVGAIAGRDPVRAEDLMRRHIEVVREGLLGAAAAAE